MTLDADRLGPVEYALIAFPGNSFNGQVAPALARLVEAGLIRIIDLTFVAKDSEGTVTGLELDGLPADAAQGFADLDGDVEGLLTESDIAQLAEGLLPDSSGLLVVWESTWAAEFAVAVRDSGGLLVTREQVPHETVVEAVRLLNASA
jgi:Family of unknown function (DUF6325)